MVCRLLLLLLKCIKQAFFVFIQEEEFTGFGTSTKRRKRSSALAFLSSTLSKEKFPPALDHSSGTNALTGKIVPKDPKPAVTGKIVHRVSRDSKWLIETPVANKRIPKLVPKLRGHREAVTKRAKVKASSKQRSTSADLIRKAGETATYKLEGTLTAVKDADKTSKVKGQPTEQLQPHSTRTFPVSFHKRRGKRIPKSMGASPEAAAEAGAQSEEEAAMPLECKVEESPKKRIRRRPRKFLFCQRRRPAAPSTHDRPKGGRPRSKRVFYTYVSEPVSDTLTKDSNKQQDPTIIQFDEEHSSGSEPVQHSANNSSPAVAGGRSSRVIKAPRRFFDEGMILFPKGSLSTWLKSQHKEDENPSSSPHESDYNGRSVQSDAVSSFAVDSPSAVPKSLSKSSPGTSHVELYKNLKKLTLKLAEKKKGQCVSQEDSVQPDDNLTYVKKRRRSKLTMEEVDCPGVVRKLAVVVNSEKQTCPEVPVEDEGCKGKD